jgi:hypothetical protein
VQKGVALAGGKLEMVRQQLGQLPRGLARIGFELLEGGERTARSLREFVLCEVERFAPLFDPASER